MMFYQVQNSCDSGVDYLCLTCSVALTIASSVAAAPVQCIVGLSEGDDPIVGFQLSKTSITPWLFNIAMENCLFIDEFP